MLNVLILLLGIVIMVASLGVGILLPVARTAAVASTRVAKNVTPPGPVRGRHVAGGIIGSVVGAVLVVIGLAGPFVEVPAGNVGVVMNFGQVQPGTLEPGLHIVTPIVQHVVNVDTRVQPHQFQEIDAASKEYQTVKLTGTMNYHVDGQFASDLFQRVGTDFASKVIDPAFNDYIKAVVPTYTVDSILGARDEIRQKAKDALAGNLAQYHIIVDDIYIANIAFSDAFQQAIEAKQVAQQQVQTEQQILAQRDIQAQQAVKVAQGQADAQVALAKGQAEANRLIAASLSDPVLQYQLIQKLSDKIQVMMVPSGNGFILDLKNLIATSPGASPAP
jgi:regulator of protease activity HflC (stomatin/prohibitin superfamily)